MNRKILLVPLLLILACDDITGPSSDVDATRAGAPPPGVTGLLWGSSSQSSVNPASLFSIDEVTGAATLIGSTGLTVGNNRISSIDFDPVTGRLYGIRGGACHGAILIELDPATGAGTVIGTLQGGWFDGSPTTQCQAGADALAFAPDGTLYVGGWNGGTPQGKIMRVDRKTGTVLEIHATPIGFGDWRNRRVHVSGLAFDAQGRLWASRGNSAVPPQLNTIDPATGNVTSTLLLFNGAGQPEDTVIISDITFASDGTLYASLPWENMLATIDTSTGVLTRIGSFTGVVDRMAGITSPPRTVQTLLGRYWFNEAEAGQGPTTVMDDMANPLNLGITYTPELQWALQNGHRGLESNDFNHDGVAQANAAGSKYETNLNGATQATFVVVAAWLDPPYTAAIAGFTTRNFFPRRVAMFQTNAAGQPQFYVRTQAQPNVNIEWPLNLDDGVRRVFHIVYDSNDPVPERRIRLYVDGVEQAAGQAVAGAFPALGEALDFRERSLDLQILNGFFLFWSFPPRARVFYYAVYQAALTDGEIAGNATALLGDDDDLP